MLKLKDTLFESPSKKLRIFDFDNTLVTSNSRVKVIHKDGTSTILGPGGYAMYDKKEGDKMDYSQFKKVIEPKEIKALTKVLRQFYNAAGQRRITILTARGVSEPIKKFMKTIGIPNIEVVALDDANPQKKADWIEDRIVKDGYDDIFFVDDSSKNVDAVNKLKIKYPSVKWNVRLAKYV